MATQTLNDCDIAGKTVLMRVDFNVPLKEGAITDDARIVAALPSINQVLDAGGKLVIMSHCGRPKGKVNSEFSMKPAAARLAELIGRPVQVGPADAIAGPEARAMVAALKPGEVLCLENVRFDSRENTKDDIAQVEALGQELADLGADVYVNDAFGTCHRKHASMWACPKAMKAAGKPAVAGLLVEKEIRYLHGALAEPKSPFIAILGGAKVSDKIKLIDALLNKCDKILIGGAMAYTLLKSQFVDVGTSMVEEEQVENMKALMEKAGDKIVLPCDHIVAPEFMSDDAQVTCCVEIPEGMMGLDIGPKSIEQFTAIIAQAGTVVWNGPMGVFEREPYAGGTKAVMNAIAGATQNNGCISVIGGGDSAAAVKQFGLADKMTHVSTGGGASLTYLEGKAMPPIDILD